MSATVISQRSNFECAYLLSIDSNVPPIFQAHHYHIEVSVSGNINESTGVLISFHKLKEIIDTVTPNNAFIYNSSTTGTDSETRIADAFNHSGIKCVGYNFIPSIENLVNHFAQFIQNILTYEAPGVNVIEVKLRETSNSFASWKQDS